MSGLDDERDSRSVGELDKFLAAFLRFLLSGIVYFAGARLGYAFAIQPEAVVVLWPPNGLILATLLLMKKRHWPAVLSGAFTGCVLSELLSKNTLTFSLDAGIANCTEIVVAAWLLVVLLKDSNSLATLREVLTFVVGAAIVSNAITAFLGALVLHRDAHVPFWYAWFLWWTGDGLGMLVMTPVILTWRPLVRGWGNLQPRRVVEAVTLFCAMAVVGQTVLGTHVERGLSLPYMNFPFLLWAALRFGPAGAATASLVLAALTGWNTAHGVGPFATIGGSAGNQALQVYAYLSLASLSALIPAAIFDERKVAEQGLWESQGRYRNVVETATDCIITINQDSTIVFANSATERVFGYNPQELQGRSLTILMPDYLRELHKSALARYVETGKKHFDWQGIGLTGLHKSGNEVPVEVSFGEVVKNGEHVFTGIIRDVSERKEVEEKLRDSRERYRLLFEEIPHPMCVFDRNTLGFIELNATAIAVYGYSREEFLAMRISDLLPPEDIPRFLEYLSVQNQGLRPASEWRHRRKDGHRIDVEITAHNIAFQGKDAVLAVAQDVTSRKRAQEQLRQSETRYRELVEHAVYGIFRATVEGKVLDVNPAVIAMLHYDSKEEVLARDLGWGIYADPSVHASVIEEILRKGRTEDREAQWKRKDGQHITVRLSGRAVPGSLPGAQEVEWIVQDVTQRKALEVQIAALQKFEAIGQLAGGIAHDFNNVIGAIQGWTELCLEDAPAGSRIHDRLDRIHDQTARAASLTRQVLAFARRQILEPRNLALNDLIREVSGFLKTVIGEHIEIKTALARDLNIVHADPSQMEQVLMNLILNARDAMPRGGLLLIETQNRELDDDFCQTHSWAKPGHYALLSVTDTGCGMDEKTLEHIFEPFFTTKEVGKGTGLGLATVYGIIKQHDGFLLAYSEPDQGTVFRIYLPTTRGVAEKREKSPPQAPRGGSETILLAEDHDDLREMAATTLELLGYRVLRAADGIQALELFRTHHQSTALAILDVVMPKLRGPEAYEKMCVIERDFPVIFATGYSAELELLSSPSLKAAVVLQKPYSRSALGGKVREVLDKRCRV